MTDEAVPPAPRRKRRKKADAPKSKVLRRDPVEHVRLLNERRDKHAVAIQAIDAEIKAVADTLRSEAQARLELLKRIEPVELPASGEPYVGDGSGLLFEIESADRTD